MVISTNKTNWFEIFKGRQFVEVDGAKCQLVIDQAPWDDIHLTAYSDHGGEVVVEIQKQEDPLPNTPQVKHRTFKPHFVLIRNVVHSTPKHNYRNLLFGFMFAAIPTFNNAKSIYDHLEKPIAYGGLLKVQNKLGRDKFPLIEQYYYPSYHTMAITPSYPLVVKVGHVHSGLGKVRLTKHDDFNDLVSVLALHEDYSTAERYYEGAYDLRIQKIGDHVRVLKRTGTGQWKTNNGTALLEEVPLTPQYKLWVDEASKEFNLEICALDVIHTESGEEYILELNDTSIGLSPEHEWEDSIRIRDLALQKLIEHYQKKDEKEQEVAKLVEDVNKLNLINKVEDLERKMNALSDELTQTLESNERIRQNYSKLRNEKSVPFKKGLAVGLSFAVAISAILFAYFSQ
uniref:ATP-grasp domain-containing protein n=1 Tax=Arcella intermedia TaxID=1963864 RepID=A0A6B2L613_9EUKA